MITQMPVWLLVHLNILSSFPAISPLPEPGSSGPIVLPVAFHHASVAAAVCDGATQGFITGLPEDKPSSTTSSSVLRRSHQRRPHPTAASALFTCLLFFLTAPQCSTAKLQTERSQSDRIAPVWLCCLGDLSVQEPLWQETVNAPRVQLAMALFRWYCWNCRFLV